MRLASLTGLDVAPVSLTQAMHRDVLLIERFDRVLAEDGWQRKAMVSALTLLSLDEMMARYASYEDVAEIIRHCFAEASSTLQELFSRLIFNVLCGNMDDHARNHAAFWDGHQLRLIPAYDICSQTRTGNEASQATLIMGDERMSRISSCLDSAPNFLLSREKAIAITEKILHTIIENWDAVFDEASLSQADRRLLWGRQFLNAYAFENLEGDAAHLRALADEARI
jgi:serine/threonine-protein kinase HipA